LLVAPYLVITCAPPSVVTLTEVGEPITVILTAPLAWPMIVPQALISIWLAPSAMFRTRTPVALRSESSTFRTAGHRMTWP
jgi:hypothetical protein